MKRLNYALIFLFTISLMSCGEDEDKNELSSNYFIGQWVLIDMHIDYIDEDGIDYNTVINDTLLINSNGTAELSRTVFDDEGKVDYYQKTETGTWNYNIDSNYFDLKIKMNREYSDGSIKNGYEYNIDGVVTETKPFLVIEYKYIGNYISYIETKKLKKIK